MYMYSIILLLCIITLCRYYIMQVHAYTCKVLQRHLHYTPEYLRIDLCP